MWTCACVFFFEMTVCPSSQGLLLSVCAGVSGRTGGDNHQGQFSRVSLLPAENSLRHLSQKILCFPNMAGLIFWCRHLAEVPADGNCTLEYLSGTFNTREGLLLRCCLAVTLPQFPQKEPRVQKVLTDLWFTAESELLNLLCKK